LSTVVDYALGYYMYHKGEADYRKWFLLVSLSCNLGLLFTFKYYNFFVTELNNYSTLQLNVLDVLLPVGISFYTFQTLSYTIDIYNHKLTPERHFGRFALFVSFFPQLVAGPIERAKHLLPQLNKNIHVSFKSIYNSLPLISWGLFKKAVIADRLALVVDPIFNNPTEYSGIELLIGTYFFAFQIFCDFSGYSDMAIGLARMFGIDIMTNFRRPYLARSLTEFWGRWHISLSTWFRDYLYIPLGGNRKSGIFTYRNLFIVFLISGLWHGANWTFIVWGSIHGGIIILEKIFSKYKGKIYPLFSTLITFHLVLLSWVFFRSDSVSDATLILERIVVFWEWPMVPVKSMILHIGQNDLLKGLINLTLGVLGIILLNAVHIYYENKMSIYKRYKWRLNDVTLVTLMWVAILLFGVFENEQFIYFQF